MVLGMLFENFKNYYILRYVIYEFLKKVLGVPQPTCLVRVFCAQAYKDNFHGKLVKLENSFSQNFYLQSQSKNNRELTVKINNC